MSEKHTPGPWKLLSDCGILKVYRSDLDGQTHIATIHPLDYEGDLDHYGAEANANWHLIALAPELLEALEEAWDVLQYVAARRGLTELITHKGKDGVAILNKYAALIAKARQ